MIITNGRKIGDLFGKFTSHQWNGSALNDYLIAPNNFQHKISSFSVGDYVPWLSDHCPIYSTIVLNDLNKCENLADKPIEIEPDFIFDSNSKDKFFTGLKSEEISQKISHLLQKKDISALHLGDEIKSILIDNARKCKIKTKHNDKSGNSSAPWFEN